MKKLLIDNSLVLTIVYTVGHVVIAAICNRVITGASFDLAALDAIIEPCINGVWFYFLHNWYKNRVKK